MALLHKNSFILLEVEIPVGQFDVNILLSFAHKEVLDASLIRIKIAVEEEFVKLEISSEFCVYSV